MAGRCTAPRTAGSAARLLVLMCAAASAAADDEAQDVVADPPAAGAAAPTDAGFEKAPADPDLEGPADSPGDLPPGVGESPVLGKQPAADGGDAPMEPPDDGLAAPTEYTCPVNTYVRGGRCHPCPVGQLSAAGSDPSGETTRCVVGREVRVQMQVSTAASPTEIHTAVTRTITTAAGLGSWLYGRPSMLLQCGLPSGSEGIGDADRGDVSVCSAFQGASSRRAAARSTISVVEVGLNTTGAAYEVLRDVSTAAASDGSVILAVLQVAHVAAETGGEGGILVGVGEAKCRARPPRWGWRPVTQSLPATGCRTLSNSPGVYGEVVRCDEGVVGVRVCSGGCGAECGPVRELSLSAHECVTVSPDIGVMFSGSCPSDTPVLRVVVPARTFDLGLFRRVVSQTVSTKVMLVHVLRNNAVSATVPVRRRRVRALATVEAKEVWFQLVLQDRPSWAVNTIIRASNDTGSVFYQVFRPLAPVVVVSDVEMAGNPTMTPNPDPRDIQETETETAVWVYAVLGVVGVCLCWACVLVVASWTAPTQHDRRLQREAECRRVAEEASGMHKRTTLV
eukprot:TRINITY_DN6255_c0_g2_i2.p1 TRINITY_DN6255_c0_g2~~TRINITY_DN6255_c0_g2_i2.p1  ORF type:complete len:565 (+),score=55.72 TRINITY_DN6255_c0_g2_i2:132-1826(+)